MGTHEQQFNRLIQCIDEMKGLGEIAEDVMMQTGYCTYKPMNCQWRSMLPYREMLLNVATARIVITHGGPSSFIMPLQIGKIPIVVPRKKDFNEHVNNHQVEFVQIVHECQGNILPVYEIENLKEVIESYETIIAEMPKERLSHNKKFNNEFAEIVKTLFKKQIQG